MARDESNREDLLREATALVERVEINNKSGNSDTSPIVAGFRSNGALSIFFGEDTVYQFNAAGELRRAYSGGLLLKATHGRLASLQRIRTASEIQLRRTDLTDAEQADFSTEMCLRLSELNRWLGGNEIEVVGQVPADANVLTRLRQWFSDHPTWPVAARPNA